jgi:RNA polymerase sigma-70 factor, ECF subfamily
MATTMTDDALVDRWAVAAANGDPGAADAFCRATGPQLTRFLAGLAGAAQADDLAQETYERALRSLPTFAGRSTARTWLLAIGRRVAADHIRQQQRRPRVAALADWQLSAERAGRATPAADDQIALSQLLERLADDRREAFVATQIIGLSYAEAAEVCGCPIGTIRSRVARAREDLIEAITTAETAGLRSAG